MHRSCDTHVIFTLLTGSRLLANGFSRRSSGTLQKMLDVIRENASEVVAYTLDQITGYEGREPPFTLDLDTDSPIFQPPRRNFALAEREIIDKKCDELEESNACIEIKHSKYVCDPVLAAKRAHNGTWSNKRFCINFIPINRPTELDRYGCHRDDELFEKVKKAKYLTALDLRSGFPSDPNS
jgi:hypothetical protein